MQRRSYVAKARLIALWSIPRVFYVSGWCSRVVVVHSAAPTTQRHDELVRHNCGNFICLDGLGEHRVRRRSVRNVILQSIIHSVGTAISRHISVRMPPDGQEDSSLSELILQFFIGVVLCIFFKCCHLNCVESVDAAYGCAETVWCVGLFSSFC